MSSPRTGALVSWLLQRDCVHEDGLSEAEMTHAERHFGVRVPSEWRAVLARVHPVSLARPPRGPDGVLRWTRYPDWRRRDEAGTRDILDAPVSGVLFDVENIGFWWPAWGDEPEGPAQRWVVAAEHLERVPSLVPLLSGWYIAPEPGGPVFSIHQTDLVIVAATVYDLAIDGARWPVSSGFVDHYGGVPFWSDLARWSQLGLG